MQAIRAAAGGEQVLCWRQPHAWRQEFELRAGGEAILATLRWQSLLGSLVLATTAEGRWTFQQTGLWRRVVTVRRAGEAADLAVFVPHWNGSGTLNLVAGHALRWRPGDIWLSRWAWHTASGVPLLTIGQRRGVLHLGAPVTIAPAALTLPELDVLITLGWYLLVLRSRETVPVATTTG